MDWIHLNNIEKLDELKRDSEKECVLLFKYSPRCSINMIIRNMLERDWNKQAMSDIKTYFLNVIANRDLSSKAASEFNVVHQSPQAIIIYKGNSIYDSSHGRIRYEELCKVLLKKENC